VLSTVKRDSIRVVFKDTDGCWQAKAPNQEILGLESAIALNYVMGVNPIPKIDEAQLIADYTAAIESGTHDNPEGQALRTKLFAIYGAAHPVLIDADRLIRFQSFKLRQLPKAEGAV
jgi:predicted ATP-binding protein involved in virulence